MTKLDSTPFTPPNTQETRGILDNTPFAPPQKNKQTAEVGDEDIVESLVSLGKNTFTMGNDLSRMFLQGISLNTYQDGKAWLVSSLMDKGVIDQPEHLNNLSGEELYEEILRGEQGESSRFRAESPYLSASGEIIGGALSPNPAGKVQAASSVFRLGKAALEGGVAGYFGEDVDKRDVYDAAYGAGVGTVLQGSLESLGWLVNKASSRKIAKELLDKETGEFTPISVAADLEDSTESTIHSFYTELASPSFGAQKGTRAQEESFVVPLKERMDSLSKDFKEVVPEANKKIALLQNKQNILTTKYLKARTELLKKPKQEHAEALEILDLNWSKDIRKLSVDAENSIKTAEDSFRLGTMLASVPEQVNKVFTQELNEAANPNVALRLLDAHWASDGFAMLNDRTFNISSEAFDPATFGDDLADFAPDVRDKMLPLIKLANSELLSVVDNGIIPGKELTKLRTMFRQRINALGDDSAEAAIKAGYSVVTDRLESIIRTQLKGTQLTDYLNELKSYKTYTIFRNAVDIKSRKTGEHGAFSADDWMTALGKVSSKDRRQGEGLFREEAERLGRVVTREQATQKKVESSIGKNVSKQKAKEKAKEVVEISRLKDQTKDRIKRLTNKQASQRDVIKIAAEQKALNEIEPKLVEAKQEYKAIRERTLDDKVNWFKSLVTTGMLGTGMGATLGALSGDALVGLGGVAAGAVTAKNLIKPIVQRTVAGQTAPQQAVQSMLSSEAPKALQGVAKTNEEALKYISPIVSRILGQ
tara:strand:- start:37 stop:2322 length:2286 start_codon:yes stop_codon:yes gene_type:complete